MWIKIASSKSTARHSLGVRSCSPQGCALSGWHWSRSCMDRPMARRLWIRTAGGKSAARRTTVSGAGFWDCKAAPLHWQAVPGAAGKGPVLWEPARCLPDTNQSILWQGRRSPSVEWGSGSAKHLPSGLCPELQTRAPLLWGPARSLLDAYQGIQLQERCFAVGGAGLGDCGAAPLRAVPKNCGKVPHFCGDQPAACWMQIGASGSLSTACRWLSWAQEVRSTSHPGCARSCGQGPHSCGDWPTTRQGIRKH
jgi:hypothetical protein